MHLLFVLLPLLQAGVPIFAKSCRSTNSTRTSNPTKYVNQFIGTIKGGHVFAGATLPWGSVKAVADSDSNDNQGGWVSDGSPVRGISPLHDDGTGGSASLGQFKLLPMYCKGGLEGCDAREKSRTIGVVENSPKATPGYFGLGLESGIQAEVTVTSHAALYRFNFNDYDGSGDGKPVVVMDLTNDLQHSFSKGHITLEWAKDGQMRASGYGQYRPSFGLGDYKVYYCLDVPNAAGAAYYNDNKNWIMHDPAYVDYDKGEGGAIVQLKDDAFGNGKTMLARIGISWKSTGQACAFAEQEIPNIESAQFDSTRAAAQALWDTTLGSVQVDPSGVEEDRLVLFWSSLYRSYIAPTNLTGDNPLWEGGHYWDSMYCIWDSYRIVHPLYAITQRQAQTEFVQALIDIYRNLGYLPDCRMSTNKGFTQGGSNADNLLSDSYVKGIRGEVNWSDGLAAMIKDATVTPKSWQVEGRGGIENRKKLGYVPMDDDTPDGIKGRSASRMLEYAFNDFGIALVANGEGDQASADKYAKASGEWENLWDPSVENTGFSGFIQPRYANGSFSFVDPRFCSPVLGHFNCFLNEQGGEFYEAASWAYSFFVPHDMARVINLMGGSDTFVKRLDTFFSSGFHDMGDEPGFLPCFLYNYAGQPAKTVDRVLTALAANYSTGIDGLPGNDDSGAMGGFVVYAAFGFYPIAGTSVYVLSTPLFKEISFPASAPGKQAVITTVNFDGATNNKYIQSAKLNGKDFTRNWFAHNEFFGEGGVLELTLGPEPSTTWGTAEADLPPSLSTSKSLAAFS